jgi:hypothetical protein
MSKAFFKVVLATAILANMCTAGIVTPVAAEDDVAIFTTCIADIAGGCA